MPLFPTRNILKQKQIKAASLEVECFMFTKVDANSMVIFHPSAIPEEQLLLPAKKCEETLFTEELGGLCKERDHLLTTRALNSVSSSMALMIAGSSKRSCYNHQRV